MFKYSTTSPKTKGDFIMETKITIDLADVLNLLHGIHELAEGMNAGIYSSTTFGVLTHDERMTDDQNAQTFVCDNYELTAGAFRVIASSMGIITAAITNGELNVVGK